MDTMYTECYTLIFSKLRNITTVDRGRLVQLKLYITPSYNLQCNSGIELTIYSLYPALFFRDPSPQYFLQLYKLLQFL